MIKADQEALAKSPNDVLPQIRLAYLYAAHGDAERAQDLWTQIEGRRGGS
jgi:hypothetical protein